MRKIQVFIRTNDNNVTNTIFSMMNSPHNDYEINPIDCADSYIKPIDELYYYHAPIAYGVVYYQFNTAFSLNSKLEDYEALVAFSKEFQQKLIRTLENSPLKDRVSKEALTSLDMQTLTSIAEEGDVLTRQKLGAETAQSTFSTNQTGIFFSVNHRKSNRVKAELVAGALLGLCSIPLFFFDPISASVLAAAAIFLMIDAILEHRKEQQGQIVLTM